MLHTCFHIEWLTLCRRATGHFGQSTVLSCTQLNMFQMPFYKPIQNYHTYIESHALMKDKSCKTSAE